jgi:hypothetical protein
MRKFVKLFFYAGGVIMKKVQSFSLCLFLIVFILSIFLGSTGAKIFGVSIETALWVVGVSIIIISNALWLILGKNKKNVVETQEKPNVDINFEVKVPRFLLLFPVGFTLGVAYIIISSLLTTGNQTEKVSIIAMFCFFGLVIVAMSFVTSKILKSSLLVRGNEIIVKRVVFSDITFNVGDVTSVKTFNARGTLNYKVMVGNKCVFSFAGGFFKNADLLIKYFQNHNVNIL